MDNGASSYRRFRDNGDESGLTEIIRDYKDGLIFYLNSFVGNILVAEELAEDTFVILGIKKPKDKGKGSFKTWLYTIGRNMAIDYLRKKSKQTDIDSGVNENKEPTKVGVGNQKPYPYEERTEYIPKEIPLSKYDNGFFAYNQIKDVDETIVSIYGTLYDGSALHRECIPLFANDGSVSFLRESYPPDSDEAVFADIQNYLGEQNNLLQTVSSLPQNRYKSARCSIMQNGTNAATTAIGADLEIYENCHLDVIVSHDFNNITNEKVKNHINKIKGIINNDTVSVIDDKKYLFAMCIKQGIAKKRTLTREEIFITRFIQRVTKSI